MIKVKGLFQKNANDANSANLRKLKKIILYIVDYKQYNLCVNLRFLRHLRSKILLIQPLNLNVPLHYISI